MNPTLSRSDQADSIGIKSIPNQNKSHKKQVILNEAREIEDKEKKESCITLINNLLFERDLWKRVFEISGTDAKLGLPILEQAKEIIEAHGYLYQQVSSANSLTRFQPRDKMNKRSKNYLRIIKKDIKQFPRVRPIEDHSTVIEGNQKITIHRIYASASFDKEGRYIPKRIKELLNQKFSEE